MNEQEQKFKDSETAIASLQVHIKISFLCRDGTSTFLFPIVYTCHWRCLFFKI